ncbi:MAG: OB-fold nucleic acid binding domain-containing protein [Candidatus Asgardarchaeia archaeon]
MSGEVSLEEIINKIAKKTGLSRKEIFDKIKLAKQEFGEDLISDLGAAHIVARELNVDVFENIPKSQGLSIKDLNGRINEFIMITGRITRIFGPKSYKKGTREGRYATLIISDKSGSVRVVLWNENVNIIDRLQLSEGDIVKIVNGFVKENRGLPEIHIYKNSRIQKNPPDVDIDDFKEINYKEIRIKELKTYNLFPILIRGVIVSKSSEISTFSKKDGEVGRRGSFLLYDGEDIARVVLWDEATAMFNKLKIQDIVKIKSDKIRRGKDGIFEVHINSIKDIEVLKDLHAFKDIISSIKNEKITKIGELDGTQKIVNLLGRISSDPEIKIFSRTSGDVGKRIQFTLSDQTGSIVVRGWSKKSEKLLSLLAYDDLVELDLCLIKTNIRGEVEARIMENTIIKKIEGENNFPHVNDLPKSKDIGFQKVNIINLKDVNDAQLVTIKGFIVGIINKKIHYNACPICYSKVEEISGKWICKTCGEIEKPVKRYVLTAILDDGTSTIRVTLIGDTMLHLLKEVLRGENIDNIDDDILKDKLLGLYLIVNGKVQKNIFTNTKEVIANKVTQVDIHKETLELLEKVKKNNNQSESTIS